MAGMLRPAVSGGETARALAVAGDCRVGCEGRAHGLWGVGLRPWRTPDIGQTALCASENAPLSVPTSSLGGQLG